MVWFEPLLFYDINLSLFLFIFLVYFLDLFPSSSCLDGLAEFKTRLPVLLHMQPESLSDLSAIEPSVGQR